MSIQLQDVYMYYLYSALLAQVSLQTSLIFKSLIYRAFALFEADLSWWDLLAAPKLLSSGEYEMRMRESDHTNNTSSITKNSNDCMAYQVNMV